MFRTSCGTRATATPSSTPASSSTTATRLADVALTLTPNHRTTIGRITITGTQKVAPRRSRQRAHVRDRATCIGQSDVLESQRNLYESNLFRLAAIEVPPQRDSVKNVNIDVTEAPLHEARVGPGFNNVDFLQFQAHYTAYNLLRRRAPARRRRDRRQPARAGALGARVRSANVAADVGRRRTCRRSCSRRTTRASTSSSRRFCARRRGGGRRVHAPHDQSRRVHRRGYGGQVTFTHEVATARAGELQLPVRAQSRRGERHVLLRELRRLRHAHDHARCARTSRCRR